MGFGCLFQGDWRQGLWKDTNLFHNNYKPNIALLELYAIVMAVAVWAEKVAGKLIILRSDNTATIAFINRMRADIPTAMSLLCTLTKICLHFQIFLKAEHIQGALNIKKQLDQPQSNGQVLQQTPTSTKTGTRAPNVPLATPVGQENKWKSTQEQSACWGRPFSRSNSSKERHGQGKRRRSSTRVSLIVNT